MNDNPLPPDICILSIKLSDPRARGRGLHSSTFQLNLSRFRRKMYPKHPSIPYTPATYPLNNPWMHLLAHRKRLR